MNTAHKWHCFNSSSYEYYTYKYRPAENGNGYDSYTEYSVDNCKTKYVTDNKPTFYN